MVEEGAVAVASTDIQLIILLLIIVIPGFFGGLVSAIFDFLHILGSIGRKNSVAECKECALFSGKPRNCFQQIEILFYRAIVGIGGSFGIVFVGLWVGKISIENSVYNQILLISLCFVAGVVSYKMLPIIGIKLEEHLLERKISASNQKSENAIEISTKAISHTEAIAFARTALSKKDNTSPDILAAIQRLERIKDSFPTSRPVFIFLGRLYRKLTQYDKAIKVLRSYIDNKKAADEDGIQTRADIADALYNIACYYTLKAKDQAARNTHEDEINRLITKAIDTLHKSIKLNSYNRREASEDNDFDYIAKDDRFKILMDEQ